MNTHGLRILISILVIFPFTNLINLCGHVLFIKKSKLEITNLGIGAGRKIFQIGKFRINEIFFIDHFYGISTTYIIPYPYILIWSGGAIFNLAGILVTYIFLKAGIIEAGWITTAVIELSILTAAVDIVPYKVNGYYSEGMKIYRYIRYKDIKYYEDAETAIRSFDLIISDHERRGIVTPDLVQAHYQKGLILQSLKRFEESLIWFDKAIEINPDLYKTHDGKGNSLIYLGRYEEAKACYLTAAKLAPDNARTIYNLACTYSLLNKTDEALVYLKRAVELDKNNIILAKQEEDFLNIKENDKFKEIIYS